MGIVTAKQLKQKTGEVIRRVRAGERLTVTFRGKPVAVIARPTEKELNALETLRPFDESWKDIEQTLERVEPEFTGWEEATKWVRNRT